MPSNVLTASRVIVYPSSLSSIRDYKIHSEENISSIASRVSRNRVKEGLNITSPSNMILSQGSCVINGYTVTITQDVTVFSSLSQILPNQNTSFDGYVYMRLMRDDSKNLLGTSIGEGNNVNYLGLEVGCTGTYNGGEKSEGYDEIVGDNPDVLILGHITLNEDSASSKITSTYRAADKSRAYLYAQDIYVVGNNENGTPTDPDDPAYNYLSDSQTLDELLANIVISDGQFN